MNSEEDALFATIVAEMQCDAYMAKLVMEIIKTQRPIKNDSD